MLTYVETEGCQDGRDGRERGVDEHAPLVLSIHIHDFFFIGGCRKNVILLSLCLVFLDVGDALRGQSTLMAGNSSR